MEKDKTVHITMFIIAAVAFLGLVYTFGYRHGYHSGEAKNLHLLEELSLQWAPNREAE